MDHDRYEQSSPSFWRSRLGVGWVVLAAVAGWFLWTEHRAHVFGVLPYLLLLACPLMHVFMHHGHQHGSHGGHTGGGAGSSTSTGRASDEGTSGDRQ